MEWMLMPLKRYAEFGGRSRRKEYWLYTLGVTLLYLVLLAVALVIGLGAAGLASGGQGDGAGGMMGLFASLGIFAVIIAIVWLALLLPSIAVTVRRLHDSNRSGLWLLGYILPYILGSFLSGFGAGANSTTLALIGGLVTLGGAIMGIVIFVFLVLPGTVGPNRYGPDPLGHYDPSVFA